MTKREFQRSPSGRYELLYRKKDSNEWSPDFDWRGVRLNDITITYVKYVNEYGDRQYIVPVEDAKD